MLKLAHTPNYTGHACMSTADVLVYTHTQQLKQIIKCCVICLDIPIPGYFLTKKKQKHSS